MKSFLALLFFLILFWLALSGHYNGLLLSLGLVSCVGVALIAKRMDVADHGGSAIQKWSPRILMAFCIYLVWLAKEIVLSTITVARMILTNGGRVSPEVIDLSAKGMDDLEKVIYANSITLTPGTLTVDVNGDHLTVHTVRSDLLESLKRGDMADRVRRIYNSRGKKA
ncbi:MAG: Na+/H+ antiporter subunit E [Acidiferrobacterales bacterium]|nr:Na+/H+ antiporter subunit E [Acidiferrobacterales bacterium]